MIYSLDGVTPVIKHDTCFIADSADIIGKVTIDDAVSVWFNTVIRGDTDWIRIGAKSNIQDCSVLHTDPGLELIVGEGVTVGHKVMLHGCTIGNHALIGINSVILNGATIGKESLIGANTLITEGKTIPEGVLVMGNPGKVVRELTEDERNRLKQSAKVYTDKVARYQRDLKLIEPSAMK